VKQNRRARPHANIRSEQTVSAQRCGSTSAVSISGTPRYFVARCDKKIPLLLNVLRQPYKWSWYLHHLPVDFCIIIPHFLTKVLCSSAWSISNFAVGLSGNNKIKASQLGRTAAIVPRADQEDSRRTRLFESQASLSFHSK
jgi:hypothetical protein